MKEWKIKQATLFILLRYYNYNVTFFCVPIHENIFYPLNLLGTKNIRIYESISSVIS